MQLFHSKIDLWLLSITVLSIVISLVAAYITVMQAGVVNMFIAFTIVMLGAGLPIWLFAGTRYIVTDELLRVECGPFSWSIPLSSISSVTATRNPLSSPALSLDRLELKYENGKSILVSPSEKSAFLAAIGHPEVNL